MRAFARGLRDDAVVGECMTANPDTIAPDDTIEHAAVLMIHGGYRHLPVVDGDNPVGVLSIRDLVAVFSRTPPRAVRERITLRRARLPLAATRRHPGGLPMTPHDWSCLTRMSSRGIGLAT